jgi:hypothetical protein
MLPGLQHGGNKKEEIKIFLQKNHKPARMREVEAAETATVPPDMEDYREIAH